MRFEKGVSVTYSLSLVLLGTVLLRFVSIFTVSTIVSWFVGKQVKDTLEQPVTEDTDTPEQPDKK